jgi:hypothetical protein
MDRHNENHSQSYHATHVQNATVKLDFIGTGVRVFSATIPNPGSYEVFIDDQSLSDWRASSSSDSQLLLGSITGLEMAHHTVTLVNSGVSGDILDLAHVEVESVLTGERYRTQLLYHFPIYRTFPPVQIYPLKLSTTPSMRLNGDPDGFLLLEGRLSTTIPSSASCCVSRALTSTDIHEVTQNSQMHR